MDANKVEINLLWTGGLDSTFRICELSRENIVINPIYVLEERKSRELEIRSMKKILELLKNNNKTKAKINDLKIIDLNIIPADPKIFDAWKSLNCDYKLGSQYEYFSRISSLLGKMEIGLEKSNRSKAYNVLEKEGNLQLNTYSNNEHKMKLQYWEIGRNASERVNLIFKNLLFPAHLFTLTKEEEYKILLKMGLKSVFNLTWFCHDPIFNRPCGHCNPCKDALNEGMSWRLSFLGRLMGGVRYYSFRLPIRIFQYLKRKYLNVKTS